MVFIETGYLISRLHIKGLFSYQNERYYRNRITGTGMKAELWLNRADHELTVAQELVDAGSLLWAASYTHRAVEYALEGFIIMKTGVRPERGSRLDDLQTVVHNDIPEDIDSLVSELVRITPMVWQSDISADQIVFLTEPRVRTLIEGAKKTVSWIGSEWERINAGEPQTTPPNTN